jgi:hypothetical protein
VTPGDVARMLAACAMYDYREVEEVDAKAWHLIIGDLDFDDAMEAVLRHYADSTERMKPAHVRQGVKAVRAERRRLESHPARQLPSPFEKPDMAEQVRVDRGLGTVREVLGPIVEHLAERSGGAAALGAAEQLQAITAEPHPAGGEEAP